MGWSREQRTAYYADVKKKRGEEAVRELIKTVGEQWKKAKN